MPNLDDCILISVADYGKLPNPKFIGQTRAEKIDVVTYMYYMIWESNGILFKTYNKL